jgi:hypothetical protein
MMDWNTSQAIISLARSTERAQKVAEYMALAERNRDSPVGLASHFRTRMYELAEELWPKPLTTDEIGV